MRHAWLIALAACTGHGGSDGGADGGWPEIDVVAPPDPICESVPGDPTGACGGVGCYRRCDTCDDPCPGGTRCNHLSYCAPGSATTYPARDNRSCRIPLRDFELLWGAGCASGRPCASATEESDPFYTGSCVPVQTCVEARASEPPPFTCLYPDGTPVVTGPPETTCPMSDPRDPFCGGACPWRACDQLHATFSFAIPVGDCIGLSDQRGFGLCRVSAATCSEEYPIREEFDCVEMLGDACVCMVLPGSPAGDANVGSPVLENACRRYRELYPDHVECMSDEWTPLSP